jgi:hypothetical protein
MNRADNKLSQIDHMVNKAALGSMELLKSVPADKAIEKLMLNQAVPIPLRKFIWNLRLQAPEERQQYEHASETNMISTISAHDVEITQKTQNILDLHFPELISSHTNIMLMKTVLSYYCVLTSTKPDESHYFLMCPLIAVFNQGSFESTSGLVEAYLALMNCPKPYYSEDFGNFEARQRSGEVAVAVHNLLLSHAPSLHAHIASKFLLEYDGSAAVEVC